jgi:hypothetical protein
LCGGSAELILAQTSRAGSLLTGLAAGVMIYGLLNIVQGQRFLRLLRTARITASNLRSMLNRGEDVWIADWRSALEAKASPDRQTEPELFRTPKAER